ncbi:hypothetical protein [Pseudomonas abietaniphila]|nr:hypothetical protein [Pseudomonas abietaniphila]
MSRFQLKLTVPTKMFGVADLPLPEKAHAIRTSRQHFLTTAESGLTSEDWAQLMDQFRNEMGWTDTKLSEQIGISLSMIRQCRMQVRPMPPPARIRTIGAMGVEVTLETLLAALPSTIREAVEDVNLQWQTVRETLIYSFFDRLDAGEPGHVVQCFFDGLVELSGLDQNSLARRVGLGVHDFVAVRSGHLPIPFRTKVAISNTFSAQELGRLILTLLPSL